MKKKGYLHIYTGDGKGKSTCAAGLAVRAAGRGWRVAVFQFLKTPDSGEVLFLKEKIDYYHCREPFGFIFQMNEDQKAGAAALTYALWEQVKERYRQYDLFVLDEIISACDYGFVPMEELVAFLKEEKQTEVVITGRNAPDDLIEIADYVTRMDGIKHPYQKGLHAREGIEY